MSKNLIFVTLGQAITTYYDKVKYFLEDKKDEAHEAVQNYFAQLFDSLTPWLATLVTDTQIVKSGLTLDVTLFGPKWPNLQF